MKTIAAAALILLGAAACTRDVVVPNQNAADAHAKGDSTSRERAAEEAVLRYFRHLANWEIEPAFRLLSRMDQDKYGSVDNFRKGLEAQRDMVVRTAGQARVKSSGGMTLDNGAPYVMMVVDLGEGRIEPFRAVPEDGEWRVILADIRGRRQTQ